MADVTIGRLGTMIERRENAFLKSGEGEAAKDLAAEHERLLWLDGKLPVPHVLAFGESSMLISAIPGVPAHESRCSAQRVVEILADALRMIHAVPIDACPFRDTLEHELREAERRMRDAKIDRNVFVAATGGLTPEETLDELRRTREIVRADVFTHGDYCLPNVIIDGDALSGFVDWGQAGLADPHRDLLGARDSIIRNVGEEWVNPFFARYGIDPDPQRLRYYALLDQFWQ
jgi:aminoglycoside 3'-phosphotransferase-2